MSCHRTIIRLSAVLAVVALAKGCGDGDSPSAPPTPEPARPTTVMVSPATHELTALGTTVQLSAEVRDQNARVMAGATVTWTSSANSVATVDASGLVTAAGNGTATITASVGSASGSAVVTVTQSVASVEVSPSVDELTALGQTVQLTAEAFDENGHAVAGAEFSWESSDAAVATVDAGGLVTGVAEGVATITASAGEASGSAVVTVMQSVASVEVSPSVDELTALGQTVQLTAEAFDENGHAVAGAEFSWESSDAAVATVDAGGLVTGVAEGVATITASAGEASGSAVVTVMQSVASVEVSPSVDELTALGQTVQLTAEAFDENGHAVAGAEFSWESSDAAVATVDAGGLVTGVAEGVATITASAGEASGSAVVTVMQSVASVEVSPSVDELTALGQTVQLTAEAFDENGHAVAGAEFSWESSDAAVATVDAGGLVTGVAEGVATITASAGEASGSAVVTVMQSVASVEVSPSVDELTALGQTVQLTAEAFDENGHAVAGAEFSWESSDAAVATVDAGGLVTGVAEGVATITASAGEASGSAVVTVMQPVASVQVSPSAETIELGSTLQLTAEAFDENGDAVAGAEFSWESSDAAVATVDAGGLVTGVAEGVATITASAGEASGSAVVTVMQPVASVQVSPSAETIELGSTLQLTAEAFDENGDAVAGAEFSWESSDAAVATVDAGGLVTGVAEGVATITASAGEASGSAVVTVMQPVASVQVSPSAETIELGSTLQLTAEAFDENGEAVAGVEFSWESSDAAVATVSAAGLVTAAGNGTATITATAGSASGSATVSVTVAPECAADLIVRPGRSCRYPGSDELFSVSPTGEMSFLFYSSQVGINLDLSHKIRYRLLARNLGDGSWVIEGVSDSYSMRSVPADECRIGLVVWAAQGCRYPGTDVLFLTMGTGYSAVIHHWGEGLTPPFYVAPSSIGGFLRFSLSDVQFAAHRTSDESWVVDRVANSPPTPFECVVEMLVGPGGSCVYPGTMIEFSVDADGRGSFGDTSDARAIRVNTAGLTFAAKSIGFFWRITAGPTGSTVPTADTECHINMFVYDGQACRYPGTNHTFWVRGGSGGFDGIEYEHSMAIDADGVVFKAHTLGATEWIIARVGSTSNTPPPPETRALVDRPDDFTGPQIHVVYAVASDGEDLQLDRSPSSSEYRRLSHQNQGRVSIQRSFQAIQAWLAEQIGQQLRLDTYRGETDVSFVRLPFTEAQIAADPSAMLDRIASVVRDRTGTSKALAIVYHGLEHPTQVGGIAAIESDRALLTIRGFIEVTQFGGELGGPGPVDLTMVHEIFHMMGAAPSCASRSQGRMRRTFARWAAIMFRMLET